LGLIAYFHLKVKEVKVSVYSANCFAKSHRYANNTQTAKHGTNFRHVFYDKKTENNKRPVNGSCGSHTAAGKGAGLEVPMNPGKRIQFCVFFCQKLCCVFDIMSNKHFTSYDPMVLDLDPRLCPTDALAFFPFF
jgi:hypothetical protein